MDSGTGAWSELEDVMRRQIRLIEEFAELQLDVRRCLERRDWAQLEPLLQQLNERAAELETVEEERARLWEECSALQHARPEDSFYSVVLRLPEDQRSRIAELRQSLRLSTLNLKGVQSALVEYVEAAGAMIRGYLREVCSDLKTGVYGPGGKLRDTSRFSMVLDTHS